MSLFRRVVAINAGVLVSAAILLAVSPARVSPTLQLAEGVVLAVETVLMISVNLLLLRRVFGPLEQLTGLMRRVDPYVPGRRLELARADPEAGGWLPRLPESLEQLDLLLLTVAKPRVVHRDGIRFRGLRYLDLTLAAYVGEPVTVRYDPRDLGEIRVFHHGRFLCRAIAPELADRTISLRELQAARTAQRRALRTQLKQRRSLADALCPPPTTTGFEPREASPPAAVSTPSPPRLRRYREE